MFPDFVNLLGIVKSHQRLVLIQFLECLPVLDRVGINDLVPDIILALFVRHPPDVAVHQIEFGDGSYIEAGTDIIERFNYGGIRIGLYGVIGLDPRQAPCELGIIAAHGVMIHDEEGRALLTGQFFQ